MTSAQVRVSRATAANLPLEEAATTAARRGADFFPSRIALNAASRSNEYIAALRRNIQRGYGSEKSEVVAVPKFGGGTRPAADLRVSDRILFDGITKKIESELSTDLVNRSLSVSDRIAAEDAMREGPHKYVLVADVVAFYEYIDRQRLTRELLDLTGNDELIEALSGLLDGLVGGRSGIPQASPEATVLGDVYLSIADRELARAGVELVRWADDYRIPAPDLKAAFHASALLERSLRGVGLVVSGAKTWTPSIEKYGEWIDAQRATREVVQQLLQRIRARRAQDYAEDEEQEGTPRPRIDRSLERVFLEATETDAPWGSSPDGYAASRRVQVSLRELGRTGSPAPLNRLDTLLLRFPHLTRDITNYLRRRIRAGRAKRTVNEVSRVFVDDAYPHEWQTGWLIHALILATTQLDDSVLSRAGRLLGQSATPGFVRGRAAILLATEGRLPVQDLDPLWRDFPEANRDDLLAAATLIDEPAAERFVKAVRRDPLYAAIADEGSSMDLWQW